MRMPKSQQVIYNAADDQSIIHLVNDALAIAGSVLHDRTSPQIIAKVAVVSRYAELVMRYPDISAFRQYLADSLEEFANLLEHLGMIDVSKVSRSLAASARAR